jgi:uncharacterized protein
MTNRMVLFHGNCPDGFTAAWAAWLRFREGATYIEINYGEKLDVEQLRDYDVFILDFSFPLDTMNQIADVARNVTVLDHHKTAEATLRDWKRGKVVFDMERSGAGITWDELHYTPRPKLIDYIEDRDLWRWALPHSREISEAQFALDRTFDNWNELAIRIEDKFDRVVELGEAFLKLKKTRVAKVCENVRWISYNDMKIPVVNASWDMSELGEYLCAKYPEAPAAGYYFDRSDKRQWGFRSNDKLDVSEMCKLLGGGGHRNAAGFISKLDWFPKGDLKNG